MAATDRSCADFVPTAATRKIVRHIEDIGQDQDGSKSTIIVHWGSTGFGKTQNILYLSEIVNNHPEMEFIRVQYRDPPGNFLHKCREFETSRAEGSWQLLLLDCNEPAANNNNGLPEQLLDDLREFLKKKFHTTVVCAAPRRPESDELSGHDRVKLVKAEALNTHEINALITKQYRPDPIAEHVLEKLEDICRVFKNLSPRDVKSNLMTIKFHTDNVEELEEKLSEMEDLGRPPSRNNRILLERFRHLHIWKVVSFVENERFTKDLFEWIVMVYHGMFGHHEQPQEVSRQSRFKYIAEMLRDFENHHFLHKTTEGSVTWYTMSNVWEDLQQLREESPQELEYFRVFLYALFHMIDKDLRFHRTKRERPFEIIRVKEIADKVLSDHAYDKFVNNSESLNNSPEVKFQYLGLRAAVEYFNLQSTADGKPSITECIKGFRRVVLKSRELYAGGQYSPATETLRNAVQVLHKLSNKDVKILNSLDARIKPSPRARQFMLLHQDQRENWLREDPQLLLSKDKCAKLYVGEIHAWILTVYGKMVKRYLEQPPEIQRQNPLLSDEQPRFIFEEAHAVYMHLKTILDDKDADLLQRVILVRDELLLERAKDDQDNPNEFRDRYKDMLKEIHFYENEEKVNQQVLAYENGVVRSDLLTDKYHKICCHGKMIQIDRLYLPMISDPERRATILEEVITHSSNQFTAIRAHICATMESIENNERKWIEPNCCRIYAYCLEEVALFLLAAGYRQQALIFFAYALDMFHVYLGQPNTELKHKVLRERKYIDMCRAIKHGETTPDREGTPYVPDLRVFRQCICWPISREGRDDCIQCGVDHIATTGQPHGNECAFRILYNSLTQNQPTNEAAGRDAEPTHENSKQIATEALTYLQQQIRPDPQN